MNKFIIADDHPLFRDALTGRLRKAWERAVIIECGDFDETLSALTSHSDADILLLDLNMPGSYELYGLAALRQQFPVLPIVIVSATEELETISRAMAYGAAGFIPKSATSDLLNEAINSVLEGDNWLPADYRRRLRRLDSEELELAHRVATLTPQQYKVLCLVAEGWLNKQIAFDLGITEATVKAHMTNIFRRLNVTNRTQAVILASRLQLDSKKAASEQQ
jgi:DNA-binding NarL/FixJ family response regulator